MSGPRIVGGRAATPAERRLALAMQDEATRELTTVRTRAAGWAKGAGAVTAGILGFGLIKGQSDVGELTTAAAVTVGALLLGALLTGAVASSLFLRAAYGRSSPDKVSLSNSGLGAHHLEARRTMRAVRVGAVMTGLAIALLVSGVAVTWYSPTLSRPEVMLTIAPGQSVCGVVDRISGGRVYVDTADGEVPVELDDVIGLAAVDTCP